MSLRWTRRSVLSATGALAGASVATSALLPASRAVASPGRSAEPWQPVLPADLSTLSPELFADDELTLPYFLHHLHTVANGVVENGPNRGFIDIHVWRGSAEQRLDHVRVMESILSLAYFYVTDRPWNLHRHSEPLQQRLRATLEFWLGRQDENGIFPVDDGVDHGWPYYSISYANTAFASKFIGEALVLLREDATLPRVLLDQVQSALRRALVYLLTETDWYEFVSQYSNQYSNVWAGGACYLHLDDDAEIRSLLLARMADSPGHFQSPAGFLYEGHGVDWRYTLTTHLSNVRMARHYARLLTDGDEIIAILDTELADWTEFLALNAVLEPDGGFVLNRAVESRQHMYYLDRVAEPGAHQVETARAFTPSESEITGLYERQRSELEQRWPQVDELPIGNFNAFTPYEFLHLRHHRWYPSDEQRSQAIARLPYLAEDRFTQQRVDPRGLAFTFVRRPSYYAIFNSGTRTRGGQRLGLGLLWNEQLGAITQSQSRMLDGGVWGTRTGDVLHENDDVLPTFLVDDTEITPTPGIVDLPTGALQIVQQLGEHGAKRIQFLDNQVLVHIRHDGEFAEDIPLIHDPATSTIELQPDQVVLQQGDHRVSIAITHATEVELVPSDVQIWDDPPPTTTILPHETVNHRATDPTVGAKQLVTVRIHGSRKLIYRLGFPTTR